MKTKQKIFIVICFLLSLFWTFQITEMFAIRGWLPIGSRAEKTITGKVIGENSEGTFYYIAWDNGDVNTRGTHRTNVSQKYWNELEIGNEIEIVSFPPLDNSPYLKDGIFASTDNIIITILLWIAAVFYILKTIFKNRKEKQQLDEYRKQEL